MQMQMQKKTIWLKSTSTPASIDPIRESFFYGAAPKCNGSVFIQIIVWP